MLFALQTESLWKAIGISPASFTLGLVGMKLGEVRKIVIPADLAYGNQPPPGIPSDAVLVFQVTLISIS